jgi:NAD(P)H dehydrogenase (quinone)
VIRIALLIKAAIAYFSGHGHTLELAKAVKEGVESVPDAEADMIDVSTMTEADWATLDACDAIIFGTPTYIGSASGAFHMFAEATAKRWMTMVWKDELAAGFTNSGSMSGEELHTLQYLSLLAAQHGMHWISLGLMPGWTRRRAANTTTTGSGSTWVPEPQTWNEQGPEAVHATDVVTARHLGARVTEQARIYRGVVPA